MTGTFKFAPGCFVFRSDNGNSVSYDKRGGFWEVWLKGGERVGGYSSLEIALTEMAKKENT